MSAKKAVVIHSGGMDSSICLKLAIEEFGCTNVLSLSFLYGQRHSASEIQSARKICSDWGVQHREIPLDFYSEITSNALLDPSQQILNSKQPNTMVLGRNGIMAQIGAVVAKEWDATCIYMGVIEIEASNSGYRDCSREYMDLIQKVICLDLMNPQFSIKTPLIKMSKAETLKLAHSLGVLDYLLKNTTTCYEGIPASGCTICPACVLRAEGLKEFRSF